MVKSPWKSLSFNRPSGNRQENPELVAKISAIVEQHRPAMNGIIASAKQLADEYRGNKSVIEKYCPRDRND